MPPRPGTDARRSREIIDSLVSGLNGTAFALGVIGIGVAASGFIVDRQSRQSLAGEGAVATPGSEPPPPPPPPAAAAPKRTRRRSAAKPASPQAGASRRDFTSAEAPDG